MAQGGIIMSKSNASYPFENLRLDWPRNSHKLKKNKTAARRGIGGTTYLNERATIRFVPVGNWEQASDQSKEIEKVLAPNEKKEEAQQTFTNTPGAVKRQIEAEKIGQEFEDAPLNKARKLEQLQKTIFGQSQ